MFRKHIASAPTISTFLALTAIFALAILTVAAQAQTFTVIHNFTGGADGGNSYAGVTLDRAGNVYGQTVTSDGGSGLGTVYKLTHRSGGWTFAPLYDDGGFGGVTIGPNGSLYGTGAVAVGAAGVFNLQPPVHFLPNPLAPWMESSLYLFQQGIYANPTSGVVFDRAGNVYGTTSNGGRYGGGTVYELSPSDSGWTGRVIYNFSNGTDGSFPYAGLVVDAAGNLYGTTLEGGAYGNGTVFELTDLPGLGWSESFLYSFTGGADGGNPYGGLTFDLSGNLYGATPGTYTFNGNAGSVFKLTPSGNSWTFSVVYSFTEGGDECGPRGTPVMDAEGNLYDTTACLGAHFAGSVFKLTPVNGGWTYTAVHDFSGNSDGAYPDAGVTFDASGNIYGTTTVGGAFPAYGVVFEITP